MPIRTLALALACCLLMGPGPTWAQSSTGYDASWYDPDAPYVQIDVTTDGVYRVSAATLQSALPEGSTLSDIRRNEIRLFENGTEIPIQVTGDPNGTLTPSDSITFIGHRNRGTDEHWAYDYSRDYSQRAQSSTYYSLYTDTTTYWMTWGGPAGKRYQQRSASSPASPTTALRDTLHAEQDNLYYFGRPSENGNSLYTFSEGYFWRRFSHNSTSPISFTRTLAVDRRTNTDTELDLSIRLAGATLAGDAQGASCHRVEVEARLRQSTGSPAFESLTSAEWKGVARQTITTSVQQNRIPEGGLDLRLTSYNSDFSSSDCAPPSETLNRVLLDWIEAAYTRSLEATENTQRFVAPTAGEHSFALGGYSQTETIHVYNPLDSTRYNLPAPNGTATLTASPSTAGTPFWAVGAGSFRSPAAVRPDTPSNWSASSNAADYLILTTRALRPSAKNLAEYRRSQDGYQVEIALVQNVFDEFDYGRPTPIAIRRFVRATQNWDVQPRFLTIFGDAQYPIDDGSVASLYPEWSVPSFGYSPSDGWFAMQTGGAEDWSEILAVGRIPVRSNAQGNLFVDKLKSYESAPLERWQKRMLLLAGGTSASEQRALQDYSNRWGEIAADTFATTRNYMGPVNTGMDTSRYYKNVNAPLTARFQDSLSVDLSRGAGWVNYFGHSSAQTWEIVTDPPSDFDNAGRLPVVSSIGCRTGSFAGGRFEEKSAPSLGERLVVGSVRPGGTPQDGARNGAIAHFGESALGFRRPSARLNDALIRRVFVDTVRVLGEAVRQAKDSINAEFGRNDFYAKHLLQYGLLGDPATKMALPKRPDLRVASNLMSVSPTAPTVSDDLTVTVEVQNRGLIPSDSVDLNLTWTRPDGSTVQRARRLQRFPLTKTLEFSFSLDERALGTNSFRVSVDPRDQYAEALETNNGAEQTQVVFEAGVSLISPSDFGTVSSSRPKLKFSVSRREDDSVPVILQLDTIPDFSSSFRREVRRNIDGLQGTWQPSSLDENTTYYWRARIDDDSRGAWKSSQFTVASTLPKGSWLQQGRLFSSNANTRLVRSPQQWRFATFDRNVSTMSERGNGSRPDGFVIDGASDYEYLRFGFGVLVMNGLTGQVRASKSFPTYALTDRFEEDFSEVGDQQEAIDSLAAFLTRVPQQGDYVFVRTRHLARESSATIDSDVKDLLRTLGTDTRHSKAIDTLTYRHVWVMKARMGHPAETVERVSPPSEASEVNEIILESRPSFPRPSGTTLSPEIGPASDWSTLTWEGRSPKPGDALRIDVLARDSTVLIDDLTGTSGQASLDQIDATKHPFLRLRATLSDSTARTSPQLTQWSLSYDGVPELAVDRAGLRSSVPDTLRQGQEATLSLPVANLGSTPSKSVRLQYSVTDTDNTTRTFARDTLRAIAAGTRDTSTASLNTADLPGLNVLTVSVESDGPPERITSNNTAIQNIFVHRDETAPSLNVLSNGRPLPPTPDPINDLQSPNLPFVSAQPTFEIHLRDDNPNLPLTDTSHVTVYLKDGLPSQNPTPISDFRRIPYASDQLTLVSPDSSAANSLRVLFEPTFKVQDDSTYTLKVEARDTQNNKIDPYQAAFRVQQEQVIKDVYPYPNPMNTHTTFAFRVKGGRDKMLQDFALRIYTLSGRLVRELTENNLEKPLGVGWNTLRWNGRDADGDRVATGVYLYRVRIEGNEQTFRGDVEKVTVIR